MYIEITDDLPPCCRNCECPILVAREKLPDDSILTALTCPIWDHCADYLKHLDSTC